VVNHHAALGIRICYRQANSEASLGLGGGVHLQGHSFGCFYITLL
jgi:hypothetical protein